jgi:hypothetical protein
MPHYSPERKEAILQKMAPSQSLTVAELSSQEGIWSSPDEKTQSTVKLSRAGRFRWGESGNLPGWQRCRGISGRLRLESLATLVWNTKISGWI